MRKIIPYIIAVVLIIQVAYAGEIFKEEVKDNVPFTINSIKHIARYYPSAKKVSLLAGEDRVLIELEDCENINDLTYCIDSAEEVIDEDTGGPASMMELRVLQSGPEIDIDRSISTNTPTLNEEVEVSTTITNKGNERATNINYEDSFPSGVKISSAYYNMIKNSVSWVGSLNPGQSQKITYKLKFQEFATFDSKAKSSVLFNGKFLKSESSSINFNVKTPFEITESISSRSVDINEEITYTITINNTGENQDISITNMEFIVPKGAVVSHRSMDLDLISGKVKYSGNIPSGAHKELSFRFKSPKIVQGELIGNIDIRIDSQIFEEKISHKIGMGISQILPEITFIPKEIKGGAELEIEVKITNEADTTISDISLDMTGDIIEPRGWRNLELEPGKKYYAFNKIINTPSSDEKREYFIKLSGNYQSETGKVMEFNQLEKIIVLPQEKLVEMTPEIKPSGTDGNKFNITLNIKNLAPYKLMYVSFIDTFPKGFKTTSGSRDIDIDELDIDEERIAYSYILKVPDTFTGIKFDITHIFNGLDKDEENILNEKISRVIIEDIVADTDSSLELNNTSETNGEDTPVKDLDEEEDKPGMFKRMWNWIKGLFTSDTEENTEKEEKEKEETN